MGLALDEPKDGDVNYDVREIPVVVDPMALKIIKESGGVTIKSGPFGPVAELNSYQGRSCH